MSNQLTANSTVTLLESLRADLAPMLAENGQSFDRLRTVFMTAVQQNPGILECSEKSIQREIRKCAADGLVPDNKEAAMIPYKGELQYQPMVLGVIKRVKELGGVFRIDCNLVHKNDEFVLDEANPDSLLHKSNPFASADQRGPVVGGYAIFRDDNGKVMHLETMSLEDFERVRKASKAPDSPAWKNWTNEMYRKAVLRRGAKYIAVNNDKIRALLERQDEMFDFAATNARVVERVDPFSGEVIDGTPTQALENKPTAAMDRVQNDQRQPAGREPTQQRSKGKDDRKSQSNADRSQAGNDGGKANGYAPDTTPKEPAMPVVPDIDVFPADRAKVVEAVEKLLGAALLPNLDPGGRRGALKSGAVDWKEATPEYVHPLLKACIDMSDWSIQRQVKDAAWTAEHAMFVHKLKTMLNVEKLNVGKYP